MERRTGRRAQAGFSFIEVLIGIIILAIVAGAVVQGFAASSSQVGRSKLDSVATEIAQGQLESARRLTYGQVGTVGGNPEGSLTAVQTRTVGSTAYRVQTSVAYVDDPALGRPRTYVNYKRVTVVVTPQLPNARAVTQTTLIAPPNFGAVEGRATAVITVVDALTDEPLKGATVTLDGSTSPRRSDVTDAEGKVVFAGLEPSDPLPTSSTHFYRATAAVSGYSTHPDSLLVRQSLAVSQTWQATIKVFKPSTIRVNLRDADTGAFITERADVKVTTPPPTAFSQEFTTSTGQLTVDRINNAEIQPSPTAFTVNAVVDCYQPASQSSPVPVGYPVNVVQAFDFALRRIPNTGYLDVWVVNNANGAPLPGAVVQVSGGEARIPARARTADANGYARFCLPQSGAGRYVVAAGSPGFGAGSVLAEVRPGQTTPLTFRLVQGATGDMRLTTTRSGALVRLQAVVGTYDAVQSTNEFAYADFTGIAAGDYIAYAAVGFSGDTPLWSSGKPVRVQGGRLVTQTVP
jgi:prepilin-type N-terminal cleavage/methylation domain-containing protein